MVILGTASVISGATIGCGHDTTGPGPVGAAQAYWALQVNQHAVNLALTQSYNTAQLTATPVNAAGTPLAGFGPVTYTATDSMVTVSPTGLVVAHFPTSIPSRVIVSLQAQGVTLADTVFIQVTQTPPSSPLTTFSMQPLSTDSAKRALDFNGGQGPGSFNWPATVTDQAGDTVCSQNSCSVLVYYHSSNPLIASIDPQTGAVALNDTGHVVFTATTLAYGVARTDSVVFRIGYSLNPVIPITIATLLGILTLGFAGPKKLILGVGAVVTFCNGGVVIPALAPNPRADVAFDDSAAVDSASCTIAGHALAPPDNTTGGNIPVFGGDPANIGFGSFNNANNCRSRRFRTPGTYHFHSTLFPSETVTVDIRRD